MNIPMKATVKCTDGEHGKTSCYIINPVTHELTHVAIDTGSLMSPEDRLLSIKHITDTDEDSITINLSKDELENQDPFTALNYIGPKSVDAAAVETGYRSLYSGDAFVMQPYTEPNYDYTAGYTPVEQVPADELAMHRGAVVEASDGKVGTIDEFIIDPKNNHISHIILREGHLWGSKEVTIPLKNIAHVVDDIVQLDLTKDEVDALPDVPVKRWWK